MRTTLLVLAAYAVAYVSAASVQVKSQLSTFGMLLEVRQFAGTGSCDDGTGDSTVDDPSCKDKEPTTGNVCGGDCLGLSSDIERCNTTDVKATNACFCTPSTRLDLIQCSQCNYQTGLESLTEIQTHADRIVAGCAATGNKIDKIDYSSSNPSASSDTGSGSGSSSGSGSGSGTGTSTGGTSTGSGAGSGSNSGMSLKFRDQIFAQQIVVLVALCTWIF